ncbi:WD repeat-containing protein 89 [Nowakowskiella sp. JEL0078]|nr:WD repeat-containing protein 89 [Nowakowskiella sp. JEL0078]
MQLVQQFRASTSYIQDLVLSPSRDYVAAVTSNSLVRFYDSNTLQLQTDLNILPDSLISEITIDPSNSSLLWIAEKKGSGGLVSMWDVRTKSQQKELRVNGPVLSISLNCNQTILAAGTELIPSPHDESLLMFWDIRGGSNPVVFRESHSDDITQLFLERFDFIQRIRISLLVCTFDLTTFEEDDALNQVIKDNSVYKVGFFGPQYEFLYLMTHIETFSLWKANTGDKLSLYGDVRSSSSNVELNYLIDCQYDEVGQRLYLWGGSNEGNLSTLHVGLNQLSLINCLNGGHSEIVRSVLWDIHNGIVLSAGEDGQICYWKST